MGGVFGGKADRATPSSKKFDSARVFLSVWAGVFGGDRNLMEGPERREHFASSASLSAEDQRLCLTRSVESGVTLAQEVGSQMVGCLDLSDSQTIWCFCELRLLWLELPNNHRLLSKALRFSLRLNGSQDWLCAKLRPVARLAMHVVSAMGWSPF